MSRVLQREDAMAGYLKGEANNSFGLGGGGLLQDPKQKGTTTFWGLWGEFLFGDPPTAAAWAPVPLLFGSSAVCGCAADGSRTRPGRSAKPSRVCFVFGGTHGSFL